MLEHVTEVDDVERLRTELFNEICSVEVADDHAVEMLRGEFGRCRTALDAGDTAAPLLELGAEEANRAPDIEHVFVLADEFHLVVLAGSRMDLLVRRIQINLCERHVGRFLHLIRA